ncbi:3-oxoacyl-ACP reductase [Bacillus canaveralius]|uniref:3-oxoacyl-ACP reductase n=1 Tax=Bacillus canaveralius TaxID=1403243 RepID=A0A2N5GP51_9BACI|nr:SDR family oxidoreductase [Bacillus canaveralius]PLR84278.1 3-oxoacyl-ACP reductase [Bacillus canaveralius]PLR89456.1 3-oxoacyl-ACP reductase [Bacillus canaveralius]
MGKFILITGASGGIGSAIAKKLAKNGYSLYLHYHRNTVGIKQLMSELNELEGEYIPIQADLSSPSGYKKIASSVFSLDAIIHNSGNSHSGMLIDLDEQSAEELVRIHVTSPLLLTKELLPKLHSKKGGNIIVISSIWGQTGSAFEVAYSAVKGAQISFVKALSKELARTGIRVNGIAPGAIDTRMLDSLTEAEMDELANEIPIGRLGNPEEVANSVAFFLSDQATYITGQILGVNGGWYT